MCGGSQRVSVYKQTNYTPSTYTNPGPLGSVYIGCFQDMLSDRALAEAQWFNSTMTVANCVSFCESGKYKFAGLEYGDQCFCGAKMSATATIIASTAIDPNTHQCSMYVVCSAFHRSG